MSLISIMCNTICAFFYAFSYIPKGRTLSCLDNDLQTMADSRSSEAFVALRLLLHLTSSSKIYMYITNVTSMD